MSGYIWDIEILGTHTQTEEVIRTFLKENHVNTGIRRGNIDCDRIVKDIRKGFDDIIWVSASIEGTRLIIQIKENEDAKIDNKADIKRIYIQILMLGRTLFQIPQGLLYALSLEKVFLWCGREHL